MREWTVRYFWVAGLIGGWCWLTNSAWALDGRIASLFTATAEPVRVVESSACGPDRVLIEESFRVSGPDPADLLMVRTSRNTGGVSRVPVRQMDRQGRVVHAYCVSRQHGDRIETVFLTVQGESSPPLIYPVSVAGQPVEREPVPLLGVHQTTRYMQFADPDKGTCCWHHVYVNHAWQEQGEEVEEITLPMRFDPLPGPQGHLYYQFYSAVNQVRFYFGLQTNLKDHGKDHGVGAIFSRWESQNPGDLQTVARGFSEIGAYEGAFVSVRKPVTLAQGPMALRLTVRPEKGGLTHRWIDLAVIHDIAGTPRVEPVGGLRFPGAVIRLTKPLKMTVESYGLRSSSQASVWLVPFFDWSVDSPRINGRTIGLLPEVEYPDKAPRVVRVTQRPDGGVRVRRSGLIDPDAVFQPSGPGGS
ncbi:MAG: hypothetical protein HQL95_07190 [Magnetococcales bacterium]|nr:hypothetical protein [Magnetococcales bacterium]